MSSHEKPGIGVGLASASTLSKQAGKVVFGKGLALFTFLLVCLAGVSGYLLGSQISSSEMTGITFMKSDSPSFSAAHQVKLESVEYKADEPEIMENLIEKIQPAASPDSDKRVIRTKLKETEKKAAFAEKTEPAATAATKNKSVRYTLAGGAYIFYDNLQKDRQFAEMLGLPFQVQKIKKQIKMTRLLVGTFPVENKSAELKKVEAYTRDAFAIHHGRKVSIYAGSFYYPVYAHRWKTRFMKKGLNVKEVSAKIEMPLYASYIGDFKTVEDAMLADRRAENAGRKMPIMGIR